MRCIRFPLYSLGLALTISGSWLLGSEPGACPTPSFQYLSRVNLRPTVTSHVVLVRQPDGSYTRVERTNADPYTILSETPGFEKTVAACGFYSRSQPYPGSAVRGFHLPLGQYVLIGVPKGFPSGVAIDLFDAAFHPVSEQVVFPFSGDILGYQTGPKTFSGIRLVDVNTDGNPDLVASSSTPFISNQRQTAVDVLFGEGIGHFTVNRSYSVNSGTSASILTPEITDLNGDGSPDVVVASGTGLSTWQISVLLNRGDGTLLDEKPVISGDGSTAPLLATGDLNGDGRPDLVFGEVGAVMLATGSGDGTFAKPVQIASGFAPYAIGDLDGDGHADLVIGGGTILFGDGLGNFPRRRDYALSGTASELILTDFDGDGHPDIVLAAGTPEMITGSELTVLFGRGDGHFAGAPIQPLDGDSPIDPLSAVVDLNGDHIPDLVLGNVYSNSLQVMTGKTDSTFATAERYAFPNGIAGYVAAMTAADFNGDGQRDFAVVIQTSAQPAYLALHLADGDGTLAEPFVFETEQNTRTLAASDFDGDGIPDLVVTNDWPADCALVFFGLGDGTFRQPAVVTPIGPAASMAVADFNGDGLADLALADNYEYLGAERRFRLLLGQGDGTFAESGTLTWQAPADYQPFTVSQADFNRDGVPDLLITLSKSDGLAMEVLPGAGDGNFGESIHTSLSGKPYSNIEPTTVADVNGDWTPDVIENGGNGLVHLVGNGDGTFQDEVPLGLPAPFAVSDFNRDQTPDLLLMQASSLTTLLGRPADPIACRDPRWSRRCIAPARPNR